MSDTTSNTASLSTTIVGQWVGILRGTNAGNVYAVASRKGDALAVYVTTNVQGQITRLNGSIRISDGVAIADLAAEGNEKDEHSPGTAEIVFDQITTTRLTGRWSTSEGNAGVVFLDRAETTIAPTQSQQVQRPVELVAREGQLPKLTLFRSEIETLVQKIKDLVDGPNDVVIAANIDGREIRQFSNDFFRRSGPPQYVTRMNLSANDGRQPLASTVIVNLSDKVDSTFFVQSDNAVWVSGSFSELQDLLARYAQNRLLLFFQKHGLNTNAVLLLAAVALLPDFPLSSRLIVLVVVLTGMTALLYVHRRVTATRIYLDPALTRGIWSRALPSFVSAITVAAITGLLGLAYKFASVETIQAIGAFLGFR